MTFTTLSYNGVEKTLADWSISSARREVSNQAGDHIAFDMMLAADDADPFPYGAQITVQIGRTTTNVNPINPTLPPIGATYSGGAVWFVGYRVDTFRAASPTLEKLAYKFAGPWEFFFERLVFQKLWATWNGVAQVADWRSQVVLGQSVNALIGPADTVSGSSATNLMSIAQQIKEIGQYVINETIASYGSAQIQADVNTATIDGTNWDLYETPTDHCLIPDFIAGFGVSGQTSASANINTVLRAPLDAVNDITCAEAMRRMLRWIGAIGSPVVWFDYTQSPPMLNISTRDQLPAVTLPFIGQTADFKIKRRDDLVPAAIALKFRISGSSGVQVVNDIATTISGSVVEGIGLTGLLQSPAQLVAGDPSTTNLGGAINTTLSNAARTFAAACSTIDFEGGQSLSATIASVAVDIGDPGSDGSAATFWQNVFPELADVTSLALYDATGAPVTVVDDSGDAIDLGVYQYRLTDGQVAPWMSTGGGAGATLQATVKAKFTYTEKAADGSASVNSKTVPYHEKTAKITLTNLPGGTYGITSAGEVIPYGLAGYIYNIEKDLQYEGTFTIQEIEVTDQCPIGNNLNLSQVEGQGLAEWATMNACVQSISYDLAAGKTVLTFGPAGHLGAKDFVERLRVNRGPRWFYEIGGNLINSAGGNGALGSNIPKHGPSPANAITSVQSHPTSMSDWLANPGTAGPAGVTIDGTNSGTAYGGTAPEAPVVYCAYGSGGAVTSWAWLAGSASLILKKGSLAAQIQLSDLPTGFATNSSGNYVLQLREVAVCNSDGSTSYVQGLFSKKYTSSLGNSI
ncbi:MAG TPA: hypothetical protein VH595_07765 [Verrucomicrobiae bacterium]|jgi:hypothetical protein|nr:hypothetical protein [Verrucomicrobiae bacterium]